ncbi:carbon monoxide dehydrogenase [Streptomyces sp. NPDC012510]|uniref:carbon monoxide dehydrogenase n=1 Tax=Streptomyces sp. NPDC012510 TaxID=3364838 RepID=UPI0036ED4F72
MEHEVFVPVPVGRLREALADPERVARAVPGLQQDAGTPPVAGRLKVRVAGHTITYRGALRVTARDDGSYAVEGDATEARGTGSVTLALALRLVPSPEGTTLACTGTATADGRITELPPDAVSSAVARLLGRFAENLGTTGAPDETPADAKAEPSVEAPGTRESAEATGASADDEPPAPAAEPPAAEPPASGPSAGEESSAEDEPPASGPSAGEESSAEDEPPASGPSAGEEPSAEDEPPASGPSAGEEPSAEDEPPASVFQTDVPPSALDPFVEDDFVAGGEPPAEAAHARRTMIGRSAEEVDHAPPRGRYAPVPAPETGSASAALRWAAPAAALVVASAIVVGRALRKRR